LPEEWHRVRYAEVLPDAEPVTLGEGFTPLLPAAKPKMFGSRRRAESHRLVQSARLGMAVTMAKKYGLKKLAIPSAGNAASALAAYAARAGIEAYIFMPKDVRGLTWWSANRMGHTSRWLRG